MNDRAQENEAWRGPLIFTVPAYGFVMALYLDWFGQPNHAAFSAKTFVDAADGETFETENAALSSAGKQDGRVADSIVTRFAERGTYSNPAWSQRLRGKALANQVEERDRNKNR